MRLLEKVFGERKFSSAERGPAAFIAEGARGALE